MHKTLFFILLLLSGCSKWPSDFDVLKPTESTHINVSVKGELNNPGTFVLPVYSIVSDLLARLELREDSDTGRINGNIVLKDGDLLIIEKKSDLKKVSINTASAAELTTLPGIGPAMAERIIQYRSEFGLFQKIEDLMKVKGIKEGIFGKIQDYISL